MINKRKKKVKPMNYRAKYKSKSNRKNVYGEEVDSSEGSFSTGTDEILAAGGDLAKELGKQLTGIQTDEADRAAAEESNLDSLDRGSRYTRKNEKLKKFKDAQKGLV